MEAVKKCELVDAIDTRFCVTANGIGGAQSSAGRILACRFPVQYLVDAASDGEVSKK